MIATTVTYHAAGYGPARPAINVKVHAPGYDFRCYVLDGALEHSDSERIHEMAYERVVSDFWQSAEELADQYGIGPIAQEGRSGGWLVFTSGLGPQEMTDPDGPPYSVAERRAWLDAYSRYRAWAEEYIDAAPARVARLAQDMAMDEIGARAVNRPYRELTLAEYRANGATTFYGTGR